MKVLAGPRLDIANDALAGQICRRLAGKGGAVLSLAALGLRNPYRPVTAAEVEALRGALRGERGVVGYVCRGVPSPGREAGCIAVADHVNLTWRSPLAGPNDEQVGPRFPGMAGVYAPEAALALGAAQDGMIVDPGVVAGVADDGALSEYEIEMVARLGWPAVSSELVAPVIVAAHMGLRVAAVVVTV